MSSATSKLILGLSCSITIGIVSYVHIKQQLDRYGMGYAPILDIIEKMQRDKMHEGVIRDMEFQQKRKIENIYILGKQNELTKQLKKLENQS